MVKHIVMWKLDENCDKATAAAEIRTALESLDGKIPGMRLARVRPAYQGTYDLVLETEFDTAADQDAYQTNPLHLEAKKVVHTYAVERGFADFEI